MTARWRVFATNGNKSSACSVNRLLTHALLVFASWGVWSEFSRFRVLLARGFQTELKASKQQTTTKLFSKRLRLIIESSS